MNDYLIVALGFIVWVVIGSIVSRRLNLVEKVDQLNYADKLRRLFGLKDK